MEKNKDLRIRKNEAAIKSAFLELLHRKTFEAITVSQICERALVNRSTFYTHFSNKEELLDSLYDEVLSEYGTYFMKAFFVPKAVFGTQIEKAYQYITEQYYIIEAFIRIDNTKKLSEKRINTLFQELFLLYVKKKNIKFKKPDYEELYMHMYANCAEDMLHWWLKYGMKDNRYQEASAIIICCMEGMNKAFFS